MKMNKIAIPLLMVVLFSGFLISKSFGDCAPYADEVYLEGFVDNDTMSRISFNVTTEKLLYSWQSDKSFVRDRAKIYVLGVLDHTEGKAWCDYKTLKTTSLTSHIYESIIKLKAEELQERAAYKIEKILIEYFPCKEE